MGRVSLLNLRLDITAEVRASISFVTIKFHVEHIGKPTGLKQPEYAIPVNISVEELMMIQK